MKFIFDQLECDLTEPAPDTFQILFSVMLDETEQARSDASFVTARPRRGAKVGGSAEQEPKVISAEEQK